MYQVVFGLLIMGVLGSQGHGSGLQQHANSIDEGMSLGLALSAVPSSRNQLVPLLELLGRSKPGVRRQL